MPDIIWQMSCCHKTVPDKHFEHSPGVPVITGKQLDDAGDDPLDVLLVLQVLAQFEHRAQDRRARVAELEGFQEFRQDLNIKDTVFIL